jgi:hypothetical protein
VALINTERFRDPGLYLLWPDGGCLELTRRAIESGANAMLEDPGRIPPHVRAAAEYQPCDICPHRETAAICHAIMPVLPFVDEIDRFVSHDRVTAVFRGEGGEGLRVVETALQEALQFVSILSLTSYCEVGRKYGPYFEGIDPLTPPPAIAESVFRRLYVDSRGDLARVSAVAGTMQEEILHTTRCQTERLRLISRRDALVNAFVVTHSMTTVLFLTLRQLLKEESPN